MIGATLAAPGRALLGEAPRVVALGGRATLHFADLLAGTIHRLDGTATSVAAEFPGETVSALIPLGDGRVAIALHRSLAILDARGSRERTLALDLPPGMRLSDGTAGPSGHLWLGVVSADDEPRPGLLLRIGVDGVRVAREPVGFANGLGFTSDGTRLLFIDSAAGTLSAIAHNPATGELGDAEVLLRWTGEGALDGLYIDAQDRAWIALFGGGRVIAVDPSGTIVDEVSVPALRVASCAVDGDTLYITTARIDAPDDELEAYPLSGSLFRAEQAVSGGPIWEGQL
ncbi:SMP-30/gluconolactonase/LRE family protein [Pseudolysinimonas sp.]|jgi:sugar lactone lactonase YvrE|uniref:SMP-30/gluconolactonase/LRE family protein n=1 Tax=Pseudolysinimonas sp. TaxID=2680009 RepID=UPI003783BD93